MFDTKKLENIAKSLKPQKNVSADDIYYLQSYFKELKRPLDQSQELNNKRKPKRASKINIVLKLFLTHAPQILGYYNGSISSFFMEKHSTGHILAYVFIVLIVHSLIAFILTKISGKKCCKSFWVGLLAGFISTCGNVGEILAPILYKKGKKVCELLVSGSISVVIYVIIYGLSYFIHRMCRCLEQKEIVLEEQPSLNNIKV